VRFAEEFLRTGNASAAGRVIGVGGQTSADLAKELEADPSFLKARADLLAHALERGKTMALSMLETTHRRAQKRPRELPMGDGGGIMIHDKGAEYARAFADVYRAVQSHQKLSDDRAARISGFAEGGPVDVRIHVVGATVEQPAETPPDVPPG